MRCGHHEGQAPAWYPTHGNGRQPAGCVLEPAAQILHSLGQATDPQLGQLLSASSRLADSCHPDTQTLPRLPGQAGEVTAQVGGPHPES